MIQCRGIWLPDGEEHLIPHIEKGPLVDGKGTYQLHKLEMALAHVKQFRRAADAGATAERGRGCWPPASIWSTPSSPCQRTENVFG